MKHVSYNNYVITVANTKENKAWRSHGSVIVESQKDVAQGEVEISSVIA
jgi:hypothetical protein